MSKAENFLIVSDMDGTFFGEKQAILPNNLQAIADFQKHGGMFTLATGRSISVLAHIFPQAKDIVSGPAVLSGGACLYDYAKKELLDVRPLDKELTMEVVRKTREAFPNAGYRICFPKGFLTDRLTEHLKHSLRNLMEIVTVDDLTNHLDQPWYKITYDVPAEDKPALFAFLEDYKDRFFLSGSGPRLTEMLNPRASKGQQIENLRKIYPGRKIVCVGDYDNDLDMLLAADIAACPANANENVQKIASIHLCSHKEGCIADLIGQLEKR